MTNPVIQGKQSKYFSQEVINGTLQFQTILEDAVGVISRRIEISTDDPIFHEYTKDLSKGLYGGQSSGWQYTIHHKEVIDTETLEARFETKDTLHAKDYLNDIIKWGY